MISKQIRSTAMRTVRLVNLEACGIVFCKCPNPKP